jgi:hypothetical protein
MKVHRFQSSKTPRGKQGIVSTTFTRAYAYALLLLFAKSRPALFDTYTSEVSIYSKPDQMLPLLRNPFHRIGCAKLRYMAKGTPAQATYGALIASTKPMAGHALHGAEATDGAAAVWPGELDEQLISELLSDDSLLQDPAATRSTTAGETRGQTPLLPRHATAARQGARCRSRRR